MLHEGRRRPSGWCLQALALEPQLGHNYENKNSHARAAWHGRLVPGYERRWRILAVSRLQRYQVPSLQRVHTVVLGQHDLRWLLPIRGLRRRWLLPIADPELLANPPR